MTVYHSDLVVCRLCGHEHQEVWPEEENGAFLYCPNCHEVACEPKYPIKSYHDQGEPS